MTDAKATVCYLNGLSLRTINEVEKILRGLPQKGTRCEVQYSKPLSGSCDRGIGDVIASKSLQIRDEPRPLSLSPIREKVTPVKKTVKLLETMLFEKDAENNSGFQCNVLTDHVRVSPIISFNGVILELDVEVTIPRTDEPKKLKLEIECPDYVPARIKIGNKWKNIV
ncbi:unnamed protein product [Caenorhabditis sp. 36 PRJEB53466]|nr:unnamed protein product [Caenorhabditis sp. 36 PRJEB53466]